MFDGVSLTTTLTTVHQYITGKLDVNLPAVITQLSIPVSSRFPVILLNVSGLSHFEDEI
jgi:hypothetical protein